MAVSHIPSQFRPWEASTKMPPRSHYHQCQRRNAPSCSCDLQGLLSVVRLGNIEVVYITTMNSVTRQDQGMLVITINPAIPPLFCTSAIICKVTVVLPLDSVRYISITLPLGIPRAPGRYQGLGSRGYCLHVHLCGRIPQLHHSTLPNCFNL